MNINVNIVMTLHGFDIISLKYKTQYFLCFRLIAINRNHTICHKYLTIANHQWRTSTGYI